MVPWPTYFWGSFLVLQRNLNTKGELHTNSFLGGGGGGSSCSAAVSAHLVTDMSWVRFPAGCLAFFSSLSSQYSILNSGPSRRCNSTEFPSKIYLAKQLEAKPA